MIDELDDAYDTFSALIDKFTPADVIKRLRGMGIPEGVLTAVRNRHEAERLRIKEMEEPRSVVRDGRDTWYTGPRTDDRFWPAIVAALRKDGWSQGAIGALDDSSSRVVSLLNHPREQRFATRGLVVGHVQSGKTTNFTSVMAKAADRKYKLFIVLAGIHNGLRRQTQARLVQQLVRPNPSQWSQLTQLDHDFRPTENPAQYFGRANRTHVLCVIKKNAAVLRKFVSWLAEAQDYLSDCPALIIDDEADQATVGTKSINPLILRMMERLPRSAYVGYTATPFANLLIDPGAEDLYPKDFVVSLPKPDGHFGTEVLFGRYALDGEDPEDVDDGHDMIRVVPESDIPCVRPETRADVDGFEPVITETLQESIEYFWLVTAARRARGTGNPHNTMLIHTSVNSSVQDSFRRPLEHLVGSAAKKLARQDQHYLDRLRVLWEKETGRVPAEAFGEEPVSFCEVAEHLPGVLRTCRVIMDNYRSQERLDYDDGPVTAIAVGGNTLSRGLTLEGLSVSYFVRSVSAYDTLLQMGRWFGFRKGYADLPRIWMTAELASWFRHIATVEAEMRRDIDIYMTEDETPLTFAVRLRTHPNLRVTSQAKMKDAVAAASSYGGKRVQTRYFRTDSEWLLRNMRAARELVGAAAAAATGVDSPSAGKHVLRNVPHELVLKFLDQYGFHEKSTEADAELLAKYIRTRVSSAGSLRRWNVAVVGTPRGERFELAPGVEVGLNSRSRLRTEDAVPGFADIKTLMSRRDAAVDLTCEAAGLTEEGIVLERRRQLPDTGLLVLYPIDRVSKPAPSRDRREPLDAEEHVIGVGLVFPKPLEGSDSEVHGYISANLTGVPVEEDPSVLEREDV